MEAKEKSYLFKDQFQSNSESEQLLNERQNLFKSEKESSTSNANCLRTILLIILIIIIALILIFSASAEGEEEESNLISFSNSSKDESFDQNQEDISLEKAQEDFFEFLKNNSEHSECILSSGKRWSLKTQAHYKYQPIKNYGDNDHEDIERLVKDATRYNYKTCFVMKARYNCGLSNQLNKSKPENLPYNYRLILSQSTKKNNALKSVCDIRAALYDYADYKIASSRSTVESRQQLISAILPPNSYFLITGNSLSRQIFESLTCLFQIDLEELNVLFNGPGMSHNDLHRRADHLINEYDLKHKYKISSWSLERAKKEGCHGGLQSKMYAGIKGIEDVDENLSLQRNKCSDNFGIATFRNNIRFAYLFRPEYYNVATLRDYILPKLFNLKTVAGDKEQKELAVPNRIFCNTDTSSFIEELFPVNVSNIAYSYLEDIGSFHFLDKVQDRDAGQYFGANNKWIYSAPDVHPCLPGIPDDLSYLTLYLILTGYSI